MRRGPTSLGKRKLADESRADSIRLLEAAGYGTAGQIRDIVKPNAELVSGAPRMRGQSGAKGKWSFELTQLMLKRVFDFQKRGISISDACRHLAKEAPFSELSISWNAMRSRYHRAWSGSTHIFQNRDGHIIAVVKKLSGDGWVTLDSDSREVIHLDNEFKQSQ